MDASETDLTTPEKAWEAFLNALETGNPDRIAAVVTADMLSKLALETEDLDRTRLRQLASNWRRWDIRWRGSQVNTGGVESATALLGPEGKEHHLAFLKTPDGWKLDRWVAGL